MTRPAMARLALVPALLWLALAACRTTAALETRAYLLHPTGESRAAVSQAVGKALGGTQVALDDDALTRDGVLNVDQPQRRDPTPLAREGRDPSNPGVTERFHLIKDGDHCVLVHDRTDRHYDLIGTACAPL